MDAILDYICEEIEEIEQKVRKDGKLSMTEIEYLDKLAHIKKDMLSSEAMMDSDYSYDGSYDGSYEGNGGGSYNQSSYARGGRGGNRGGGRGRSREGGMSGRYSGRRYSRDEAASEMVQEFERLMEDAPNKEVRDVIQRAIQQLKNM